MDNLNVCPSCGAEISDTYIDCPNCGKRIKHKNNSNDRSSKVKLFHIAYYLCFTFVSLIVISFGMVEPKSFVISVPIIIFLFFALRIEQKISGYTEMIKKQEELYELEQNLISKSEQLLKKSNDLIDKENKIEEKERYLSAIDQLLSDILPTLDGVQFERYVGCKLAIRGWRDIKFTRASGDFGADIIAHDPDNVKVCIQCKKYDSAVGISAVQEISSAKQYYDCEKAVVITNNIFTASAKELAKKINVELVDQFK